MSSTSILTFVRSEPAMAVKLLVPTSTAEDEVNDVVASQLSSPLQSYEITAEPGRVIFQHTEPYRPRLQSAKESIEELRSEVNALKDRQRLRDQTLMDWEIRSRIARALNDIIIQEVPEHTLSMLKDARLNFLPASLATWATYQDMKIPALKRIADDDFELYLVKGARIVNKGLSDDMSFIWESIELVPRSLMVNMWASRPDTRGDISHPHPTTDDGERLVDTDPELTAEEIALAKNIIHTAVDQDDEPLFRKTESSMDY